MAKQGSIRHYRQTGAVNAPPSLPYGELAVAKDGTLYTGNEGGKPVEIGLAAEREALTAKAEALRAQMLATQAQTMAQQAQKLADSAVAVGNSAKTAAYAAMPKTGGGFTGDVSARLANTTGWKLRNSVVRVVDETDQPSQLILFYRK